jgi:hypothetical protein
VLPPRHCQHGALRVNTVPSWRSGKLHCGRVRSVMIGFARPQQRPESEPQPAQPPLPTSPSHKPERTHTAREKMLTRELGELHTAPDVPSGSAYLQAGRAKGETGAGVQVLVPEARRSTSGSPGVRPPIHGLLLTQAARKPAPPLATVMTPERARALFAGSRPHSQAALNALVAAQSSPFSPRWPGSNKADGMLPPCFAQRALKHGMWRCGGMWHGGMDGPVERFLLGV